VIVDEAGRHESAPGVDDTGARTSMSVGLCVRTDCDEAFSANGKRFGAGARGIAGPDPRVADDQVSILRRYRTWQRRNCRGENQGMTKHHLRLMGLSRRYFCHKYSARKSGNFSVGILPAFFPCLASAQDDLYAE
jgi:hypothetical protein